MKTFTVRFRIDDSYSIDAESEEEAEAIACRNFAIDYPIHISWEEVDFEIEEF